MSDSTDTITSLLDKWHPSPTGISLAHVAIHAIDVLPLPGGEKQLSITRNGESVFEARLSREHAELLARLLTTPP